MKSFLRDLLNPIEFPEAPCWTTATQLLPTFADCRQMSWYVALPSQIVAECHRMAHSVSVYVAVRRQLSQNVAEWRTRSRSMLHSVANCRQMSHSVAGYVALRGLCCTTSPIVGECRRMSHSVGVYVALRRQLSENVAICRKMLRCDIWRCEVVGLRDWTFSRLNDGLSSRRD